MNKGFVKVHRKINDWEWKTKPNTVALFFHILTNVNFKETKWRGVTIHAGQMMAGRRILSQKTGLSEQQIRTAISHLTSTNDITIKSTKEYSIITVTNWNIYQGSNQQIPEQSTNDQPHLKNVKNIKKYNNKKNTAKKPDDVSEQIWNDFLGLRDRKKAPLTDTALNGIIREAKKANWKTEEAINECCVRGWSGFKAAWVEKKSFKKGNDVNEMDKYYV